MDPLRVSFLHHGGRTRAMLTIELGKRRDKRAFVVDSEDAALEYVRRWFDSARHKVEDRTGPPQGVSAV